MVASLRPMFLLLLVSAAPAVLQAEPPTTASRLVQDALRAEASARNAERAELLEQAIKADPALSAARWQAGFVKHGDQWLTPEAAAQQLSQEKLVVEYRRLRDVPGDSFEKHLALARYCRQAKLSDREQLHWSYVLQAQPQNIEARRALGLREYRGQLLTEQQIENDKQHQKQVQALDDEWEPRVMSWRERITGKDVEQREAALAELRELTSLAAIPYLEAKLSEASEELGLEVVALLGKYSDLSATASLARHAVLSSHAAVRTSAATALKERPWQTFVPGLLADMQAPIELTYYISTFRDSGFLYSISLVRDGQNTRNHLVDSGGLTFRESPSGVISNRLTSSQLISSRSNAHLRNWAVSMAALQSRLESQNAQYGLLNARIQEALSRSTGKELDADPRKWWTWWQEYNESYVPTSHQLKYDTQYQYSAMLSCFLKGTQVWTELGAVPIERVRPGDRVLSQHPATGELSYQLVLQTTVRPPAKSQWVRMGDDEILATLGHPFWVVGHGWRMTKQLEPGQYLHTPTGAVVIDKLEPGPEAEAYNLVVAGTGTYFVGQSKVLVHDNTPWVYTEAAVPGMQP